MNKLIDNLPHLKKNKNKIKNIDNFSNNKGLANKGLANTEILGVNINSASKLSGSEVDFNPQVTISSSKPDDEDFLSFLQNNQILNKSNLVEEPIEEVDDTKDDDEELENFSNYQQDFKLDFIGNFYVGSLSLIIIFYIYRSIRK
tara:strand:- start:727 stop:1161 length:435 start_codon:yes stop_codon:yes gene_type:complete